jgi:effector-binding domain-containing protein
MPINEPYRARIEAQTVARIHVVTPRPEMRSAFHSACQEISEILQAGGVTPTGRLGAHYHCRPTDTFDFDVYLPIDKSLQPSGRVEIAEIPATEVIRAVHQGCYEELPQAWHEFVDWVSANGFKTREDAFEVYTFGPMDDENPNTWKTELNCALASDQPTTLVATNS